MLRIYLTNLFLSIVSISRAEEEVNLSCNRIPSDLTECPGITGPTTEELCEAAGCYYCDSLTPSCVEGSGCSRMGEPLSIECKTDFGARIMSKSTCRSRGCSWCQYRTGTKCYTNPTSPEEMYPSEFCDGGKSDPEYDCRNYVGEPVTATECVQRHGCTWCPDNAAFKCVRDPSVAPNTQICTGSETLNCFPYPTINVSEERCNEEPGCSYCADGDEDKKCMRDECPVSWKLREDGKSCCQAPLDSSDPSRAMSWLVEYRAENTTCEGFVVAPTMVITAGQCQTTRDGVIVNGSVYVDADDVTFADIIAVLKVLRSPYYVNLFAYHDIMLLTLTIAVPATVRPLSLPFGEIPPANMTCYIGSFEGGVLSQHEATISTDDDCTLNDECFDRNFQLCAESPGENPCVSKPGAPLVCQRCSSCEWYAYGIACYTLDCTAPNPSYYTRLSAYAEFLKDNGVPMSVIDYTCNT